MLFAWVLYLSLFAQYSYSKDIEKKATEAACQCKVPLVVHPKWCNATNSFFFEVDSTLPTRPSLKRSLVCCEGTQQVATDCENASQERQSHLDHRPSRQSGLDGLCRLMNGKSAQFCQTCGGFWEGVITELSQQGPQVWSWSWNEWDDQSTEAIKKHFWSTTRQRQGQGQGQEEAERQGRSRGQASEIALRAVPVLSPWPPLEPAPLQPAV